MNTDDLFQNEFEYVAYFEQSGSQTVSSQLMSGLQEYSAYPEDNEADAPTSSEYMSEYNVDSLHGIEPENDPPQEPQVSTGDETPSMKAFVTAYYKAEKPEEFYLPRERDLLLTLVYSPRSYWETKQVTFPSNPSESFYVKKKDPEHLGEIVLNSDINVHAISIEKVGEEIRTDALRKRKQRNNNEEESTEDQEVPKVKRRLKKNEEDKEEVDAVTTRWRCDRNYALRVVIGDLKFSRTFEIRTARDLNKYRYLRKSVPLYKE